MRTARLIRNACDMAMTATCTVLVYPLGGWQCLLVMFVYGAWSFYDGMTRGVLIDE